MHTKALVSASARWMAICWAAAFASRSCPWHPNFHDAPHSPLCSPAAALQQAVPASRKRNHLCQSACSHTLNTEPSTSREAAAMDSRWLKARSAWSSAWPCGGKGSSKKHRTTTRGWQVCTVLCSVPSTTSARPPPWCQGAGSSMLQCELLLQGSRQHWSCIQATF